MDGLIPECAQRDLAMALETLDAPQPRRQAARGNWILRIAMGWMTLILIAVVFAEIVAPYDYTKMNLRARLDPPVFAGGSWAHILGTDHLGRDMLSRLINATQVSVGIALVAAVLGGILGTALGFLAVHFRRWVDAIVMALVDFQASVPFMLIALAVLAFFGNNLWLFLAILALYGWERYARLARGLALSAINQGYVSAATSFGAKPRRLYLRHVLPNVAGALLVNLTLNFPETILLESSLSFLGLGIQPPLTSLGNLLGYGRDYIFTAWWVPVMPGMVIFLTTLSVAIIADWLRDVLDPRIRR